MDNIAEYIIWGSAGHAKVLSETIDLCGGRVIALFDNRKVPSAIEGVPVYYGEYAFNAWMKKIIKPHKLSGLVAIGGGNGCDRLLIQKLFHKFDINLFPLIHPKAVVSDSAVIGLGSQVLANTVVAAEVVVGEAGIVNHNATVDHECILGKGVHIAPGAILCGCVIVGDNVFIGAGSIILPRIKIGSNSIVGAGAVVTKDVPSGVTVVGNPARQIKIN